MLVLDLIEGRHVIRQRAFLEQRVVVGSRRGTLHGRILSGDRDSCDSREGERDEKARRNCEEESKISHNEHSDLPEAKRARGLDGSQQVDKRTRKPGENAGETASLPSVFC